MKYLRWFIWIALVASIVMHLATILAEPIYAWFTQPEFSQTELKKTDRKLDEQSLDEDEKPAELANVKPAEKQMVYLQPIAPKIAVEKPIVKTKQVASAAKSKSVLIDAVGKESASAVATQSITASEVQVASALTHAREVVASAPVQVNVATASAVQASRVATQIDTEASKRFPRVVEIGYYWTVFDARMTWKIEKDRYALQLKANPAGRHILYLSEGEINARNGVKPLRFADLSPGVDKAPKNEAVFDWGNDTARIGPPNNQKIEPIEPGDQDLLSAALHLAFMGSKHPSYEMALFSGRKRYPNAVFELKGEATLTLGTTKVDAVLMRAKWDDRQVDFWLAPQWNNLPVKMSINLGKDGGSFEVLAKEVSLDGRKVLEWIAPRDQQQRRP
ncbi:DUF3108 domain-containing protein [Deefgea tanakiae]|uniref:DUF3108 domain-containing protein n=1 Tax=Deefgea tanakiae TaxID=2865840 RepID=A0ABX8Z6Y1_9NEIS|nr:DUF3108 domain-containing protein [Deefgea tanakiae]QZA78328.1 DUF3108 domain-containing protein [Deefgea tanakiae]